MNSSFLTTNRLELLPGGNGFQRLSKGLATLDAIMSAEWEFRYYSYDDSWGANEQMASMRTGSGDEYFALFTQHGTVIKGWDEDSPLTSLDDGEMLQLYEGIPEALAGFLQEPAFCMSECTFCIWKASSHGTWSCAPFSWDRYPGSEVLRLLDLFVGNPVEKYVVWAEEYYGLPTDKRAVEHVMAFQPLTEQVVSMLNPSACLSNLRKELETIGYPN